MWFYGVLVFLLKVEKFVNYCTVTDKATFTNSEHNVLEVEKF